MKKHSVPTLLAVILLAFLIPACSPKSSPTPLPSSIAAPTSTNIPEAKKSVFLISWDGGRADLVYDMMADGTLPTFASLAQSGVRAEYAQSIDPALTAAAHNSIASGAFPTHTGIVSNSFHNALDDFYWYRVGFDETMDQTEPVWVTASRAGLTTASVFFVGGSPSHFGQQADYTIGFGVRDAYSDQHTVSLTPAEPWENTPNSFSPALEGTFTINGVAKVLLLVVDSTDDATANYDTVWLDTTRSISNTSLALQTREWGPLVLLKNSVAGADFLLQEISSQQVTIFHSAVYHNNAAPTELRKALNAQFGFFPSTPDSYALEHGYITEEDYLHMLDRFASWTAQVAAWVYTTYQPDLLLTWQDGFDGAGHQFFLRDPRQLNYTPERAEQYAVYFRQAAQASDRALQIILDAIDLQRTTLLMVADHGMLPIHSRVYVNTILEQAGLLTLDSQNYVSVSQTKAFAVASGGSVNIYLNLEGREKAGTVSQAEYAVLQQQIIALLSSLKDPQSGELVFQRVLMRSELAGLNLDHPNSGDIFAQANPGYHLDGWRGNDFIFEATPFYGQHGYDSALPGMQAIFIAAGPGIPEPARGSLIAPVHLVDYVPTIAFLLGFTPGPNVAGHPIPAFLLP